VFARPSFGNRGPDRAKRLDCGVFSTAFGTHANHLSFHRPRPHESAAEAGAVQTLRDFPSRFCFENARIKIAAFFSPRVLPLRKRIILRRFIHGRSDQRHYAPICIKTFFWSRV
jgi:hypothetical protein